jgi:hypothetical protein
VAMKRDVDCAFTNNPLFQHKKAEKRVNLVAVEHEEKSPSCPVEVPFDQPGTKPPLQK